MADLSISNLPNVNSCNNSDLLGVSQNIGGNNWVSKSLPLMFLGKALRGCNKVITVGQTGIRDVDTIEGAIAAAVALSPSESNPISIQVLPGTYLEENPLTIPEWVSIFSSADYYSTFVNPKNDGDIFVALGNSVLRGFYIIGGSSFSNIAYHATGIANSSVFRCYISDCHTGIWSDSNSVSADSVLGESHIERPIERFVYASGGGKATLYFCSVYMHTGAPINGFYSTGSGTELYMYSCSVSGATNGVYANDSGYIDCFSSHFEDCTNAIHIGSTGSSNLKMMGCIIEDSSAYDLLTESATCRLAYTGHINSSKFSILPGSEIDIVADDESIEGGLITGKSSLQNKVSIGTPGAITLGEDSQLNVGEGSAFTKDKYGNEIVEYWSYDSSAPSGSKFTRFANNTGVQLIDANDAIIIGCKYPFPAIRLDVDVALNLGVSDLTAEYWNGTIWVDLASSARPSGNPTSGVAGYRRSDFAKRINRILENVETQFVEFSSVLFSNGDWTDDNDILNEIPKWDANDSFYAVRIRNNGTLTSGMTFRNGMVKPHSFMVSTSGQKANFGLYRIDKSLYVDSKMFYPDPTNPPSYVDLPMSTNITYGDLPAFLKANAISQISVSFTIPSDIDTSSPLLCYVDGAVTVSDIGNDIRSIMYITRVDSTSPGIIGSLPEVEVDQITTITTGANTFVSIVQDIDISSYRADDLLFVAFARFATEPEDTFSGDLIVGDITFRYKSKFI